MAESLRVVPAPVASRLPPASLLADDTVETLRRALLQPAQHPGDPPTCLRDGQVESWRRVMACLDAWHGAILAEPVGTGKTWIALTVAQQQPGPILVLGPSALAAQWRHTASQIGAVIRWHSHERLSRGALPGDAGFVIVDEAHRFRHLQTRRVATLAPWLAGRRTLMLTATPIINRRADLFALLRLLMADDALQLDGMLSVKLLQQCAAPPPALTRLVIRGASTDASFAVQRATFPRDPREEARGTDVVRAVRTLRLSRDPGVRRLLTSVLLDAAASSDAAWRAALRRYRGLLLQSQDAGGCMSRAALQRLAGPALDQLVLWPLLARVDNDHAPLLQDLPVVEALLARASTTEQWMPQLADILADGRPTICFTRYRATAMALVRFLGEQVAWITGSSAGIGPHRLDRHQVLGAFGPGRERWRLFRTRPDCLVCTEVVAEGLDLQGASRVIHLDLPWHPARLEQRNGRVQRIGQLAPDIATVTRRTPLAIERVLKLHQQLGHKTRLADRWLADLTLAGPHHAIPPGFWCAIGGQAREAEGFALVRLTSGARSGTIALELRDGIWEVGRPEPWDIHPLVPVNQITRFEQRKCIRMGQRAVWRAMELARVPAVSRPRLVARILALARFARIGRDLPALERLDTLLALAGRHLPMGLEQRVAALHTVPDAALLAGELPSLPEQPRPAQDAVLLVLFRS